MDLGLRHRLAGFEIDDFASDEHWTTGGALEPSGQHTVTSDVGCLSLGGNRGLGSGRRLRRRRLRRRRLRSRRRSVFLRLALLRGNRWLHPRPHLRGRRRRRHWLILYNNGRRARCRCEPWLHVTQLAHHRERARGDDDDRRGSAQRPAGPAPPLYSPPDNNAPRHVVQRRQDPRRRRDQPTRLGRRRAARRARGDVRLDTRGGIGRERAIEPRVQRALIDVIRFTLHAPLPRLASPSPAAPHRPTPAACAPAPASYRSTRATARAPRRSPRNSTLLLASTKPTGPVRPARRPPPAPSRPPAPARAATRARQPPAPAPRPPAASTAAGAECPAALRPARDSSRPRTTRRARS